MGSDSPYRIDLLDRDVETIRHFDPDTSALGREAGTDPIAAGARDAAESRTAVREFRRRYRLRFTGDL